jgi:hypothetical protein
MPPGAADARALEDWAVETADGERIGTVAVLLRRGEDVFVAVERGYPPAAHDLRAIPWDGVAAVDDQENAVRLKLAEDEVDDALELDPDRKVEGAPADAVRVTEVPNILPTFVAPEETGPPDNAGLMVAIVVALFGAVALLLAAALQGPTEGAWSLLLFLPAIALFAVSIWLTIRVYRDPSARRRRPRRTARGHGA